MSKLVINSNIEKNSTSTGLTPRVSSMQTRSSSGGGAPSSNIIVPPSSNIIVPLSSTIIMPLSLGGSSGGGSATKSPRKRNHDDISKEENYYADDDEEDSEINIPAGFDMKNFKSVKKFIDNLNSLQLKVILDRQYIICTGDIQEERIKEYFKAACRVKGVKKSKKKKPSKVVRKWTFSSDEE